MSRSHARMPARLRTSPLQALAGWKDIPNPVTVIPRDAVLTPLHFSPSRSSGRSQHHGSGVPKGFPSQRALLG